MRFPWRCPDVLGSPQLSEAVSEVEVETAALQLPPSLLDSAVELGALLDLFNFSVAATDFSRASSERIRSFCFCELVLS